MVAIQVKLACAVAAGSWWGVCKDRDAELLLEQNGVEVIGEPVVGKESGKGVHQDASEGRKQQLESCCMGGLGILDSEHHCLGLVGGSHCKNCGCYKLF
jgi:hypothetical protein